MATYSVVMPSGSTNGTPILLSSNATTLHAPPTGSTAADEVYLYLSNIGSTAETVGVSVGSTAVVTGYSVPGNSLPTLILPGIRLQGGSSVSASASTSSKISAILTINRIQY